MGPRSRERKFNPANGSLCSLGMRLCWGRLRVARLLSGNVTFLRNRRVKVDIVAVRRVEVDPARKRIKIASNSYAKS